MWAFRHGSGPFLGFRVTFGSISTKRCKDVGVKPTLDHFFFTFKLTKGHKDWASYASLSQRSSKLFTSDKKGSTKDWKPFFVFVSTGPESPFTGSGLPSFRRIPCPPSDATLFSITRQLCGKGAVNIKEVVTEESLAELGFEFVQDELRHQPDLLRDTPGGPQPDQLRDIHEGGLDCGPFGTFLLFLSRNSYLLPLEANHFLCFQLSHKVTYEVATEGRSTRFSIPPPSPSLRDAQLEVVVTLSAQDRARISAGSEEDLNNMVLLKLSQATLGMIELVGRRQDRQAAIDAERKVARLARELEEEKGRSSALETEKASLSSEVGSVSARVAELEGDSTDLIQQLEVERSDQVRRVKEAIESFKSSPDFAAVAMERMDKLVVEWFDTEPGVQWMVKEGTKSFNCGLFRAQQVFRSKLARLPKGFSFPDLGLPPPCHALAEFDPSPYLDEGSSSASDEEEEEAMDDQGGQGDQDPAANQAASKAGGSASSGI
ncbi:unnamed protein product [Cuscuta campestris]|uniref:Uncharacterized protein n=1 Tax=Cuscuta campestris TaxID=132261 RepID=A0A484ML34_9ASTE|nr:unnamed protein product [Cuscuta campestris]